jgi:sulfonate transport system substrate-binding protein
MSTSRSLPRLVASLALASVLALIASACGSSSATPEGSGGTTPAGAVAYEPVTIKFSDPGNQGAFAYIKREGLLEAELAKVNATIEWVPAAGAFSANFDAMNAGAINASQAAVAPIVGALSRNLNFKVFATQEASDAKSSGIVATADSGIKTVKDLEGKRVAVNKAGKGDYITLKALTLAGVDISKVERVPLQPPDAAAAFASGQIDAWATFGAFWTTAVENGATIVTYESDLETDDVGVVGASAEVLEKNPAAFQAIVKVYAEVTALGNEEPEKLQNIFATEGPTAVSGARLEEAIKDTRAAKIPRVATAADSEQIAAVADLFYANKAIDKEVEATDVIFDIDQAAAAKG